MWLLQAQTRKLVQFTDESKIYGKYAILSHVWQDDELSFQDVHDNVPGHEQKAGYAKIKYACEQALVENLQYLWADTCCINKLSSAELSEAINSMYRWYYEAKYCFAYLYDMPRVDLKNSKWFTRGWTLQELIAPGVVKFYDCTWTEIGTKIGMIGEIQKITSIDEPVLRDRNKLQSASVAARMAWAAERVTSKKEDEAYCLMGIFDVNMPMIYGEGMRAFARLQEEIIKTYEDQSILAWQAWEHNQANLLLSPSPKGFRKAHKIVSWSHTWVDDSFDLHNKGLRIYLPVVQDPGDPKRIVAILNCRYSHEIRTQLAIYLREHAPRMIVPSRELKSTVCEMAPQLTESGTLTALDNIERAVLYHAKWKSLMILKSPIPPEHIAPGAVWEQKIKIHNLVDQLTLSKVFPPNAYDPHEEILTFFLTGSDEIDRGYMSFLDPDGKKQWSVLLQQESLSGSAKPRVWLCKHGTLADDTALFRTFRASNEELQKIARIEFRKGVLDLVAEVERDLSQPTKSAWDVKLYLEKKTASSSKGTWTSLMHGGGSKGR